VDSKLDLPKEFWLMPGCSMAAKVSHMLLVINEQERLIRHLVSERERLKSASELVKELLKQCNTDGEYKYNIDVVAPTPYNRPVEITGASNPISVQTWHVDIYTRKD
jgi:hypothetical protein